MTPARSPTSPSSAAGSPAPRPRGSSPRAASPCTLLEMRPGVTTPAHHTGDLAELVCSNSLKSDDPTTAAGLLKRELERARAASCSRAPARPRVPAGAALAVDRERFSALAHARSSSAPARRRRARARPTAMPDGARHRRDRAAHEPGASSPRSSTLVGDDAARVLRRGGAHRRRRDARPLASSSRRRATARAEGPTTSTRPMDRDEYDAFVDALVARASASHAKEFERAELFQACQPVEEVARTGRDALRFGALKPVGPHRPAHRRAPVGGRPAARRERRGRPRTTSSASRRTSPSREQRRVFRMIPGLEQRRVPPLRRHAPQHVRRRAARCSTPTLALRDDPRVRLAGQLTGTEGYLEAAAAGLLAALDTLRPTSRTAAPFVLPRDDRARRAARLRDRPRDRPATSRCT